MNIRISKKIAQSIVEAIYEVCNCPINFIERSGFIIASTDETRVNQFHEAGFEALKKSMAVFVEEEGQYTGTKAGVNYPIFIEGTAVAVVGITGNPNEVSKYGFLATKISEVFIKEQYISNIRDSKKQKMNYLIRAYIYDHIENEDYIEQLRKEFDLTEDRYSILCFQVHERYNIENINMVERKIEAIFGQLGISCYTYLYPNEFIGFLKEEEVGEAYMSLTHFCNGMSSILKGGIGLTEPMKEMWASYEQARYAIRCIEGKEISCQLYSELGLERLLRVLRKHLSHKYIQFVLKELSTEEKELLQVYFEQNMSLKETAAEKFIHINTLQNKLNRIYEKNGLNPREFKDAVALYLAILVEKMQE